MNDTVALPRRFSGVAYSGTRIDDWDHPVIIDLATTTVEAGAPLLAEHAHGSVIGAITSARNDGTLLAVSGELFSDIDQGAADIARKAQRGARFQMSVGLFNATREDIGDSRAVTVNGRTTTGPVSILRNGIVREVSIVALGADRHTTAEFFTATRVAQ